jgi:DNA-binding IclR family transcriptional regulator
MPEVPVKSVKKAFALLSELAFRDPDGKGLSLTTLARTLGLPANTTHNLLKTMAVCGYVAQNEAGLYITGPQCRSIGIGNRLDSERFKERVLDVLTRSTAAVNEAMVFAILRDGRRRVLARSEPARQAIRVDSQTDDAPSIYSVPTGRVLVAFATPEQRLQIVGQSGPPDPLWPDSAADIDRIRTSGACVLLSNAQGIHAFAVPVQDPEHRLLGAIGCHAPAFRCDRASQKTIVATLQSAAAELADA